MGVLTETVNPVKITDVKVYHCGHFLGIYAPGASWWCRQCKRLISPTFSVGD